MCIAFNIAEPGWSRGTLIQQTDDGIYCRELIYTLTPPLGGPRKIVCIPQQLDFQRGLSSIISREDGEFQWNATHASTWTKQMLLGCLFSKASIVRERRVSGLLELIVLTSWIHAMHKLIPVEWILFSESDSKVLVGEGGGLSSLVSVRHWERTNGQTLIIGRILSSAITQFYQHRGTFARQWTKGIFVLYWNSVITVRWNLFIHRS